MHSGDQLCPTCGSPDVDHRWRVDMDRLLVVDDFDCPACSTRTVRTEAFEHTRHVAS